MLPERLKQLRTEANLTQRQLAKKTNTSQQSIASWESGERKPKLNAINKIAEYFNVSTDYLLGKTDIKERNENNSIESTANVLFRTTVKDLNLTPEQEEQLKKDLNEFIKKRRKAFEDDL